MIIEERGILLNFLLLLYVFLFFGCRFGIGNILTEELKKKNEAIWRRIG